MMQLNRGSSRRRWILTALFILFATVSMVGPTQAVSGLVAASVAVRAAVSSMLDPQAPESAPVAGPNLARSIDELMTPDFTGLVGPAPSSASDDPDYVGDPDQPAAAIGDASSQAGQSPANAGGIGGSGYQGSRPGFRFGGSGFGGMSNGGRAGNSAQEIASSTSESSGSLVTDAFSDDGLMLSNIPSLEDDARAFAPSASGPGPGPGPGGASSPGGLDLPGDSQTPQPSVPAFSANPPANGGGPSDSDPVPPSVIEPLLDELDVPPAIAGPNQLRTSPAGLDDPGVFQIPEPSTLALFGIGTAIAMRRRARRRER